MEREIVKVIEDSHNILLEVAMPDGSALLDFARTWARIQEENPDE